MLMRNKSTLDWLLVLTLLMLPSLSLFTRLDGLLEVDVLKHTGFHHGGKCWRVCAGHYELKRTTSCTQTHPLMHVRDKPQNKDDVGEAILMIVMLHLCNTVHIAWWCAPIAFYSFPFKLTSIVFLISTDLLTVRKMWYCLDIICDFCSITSTGQAAKQWT